MASPSSSNIENASSSKKNNNPQGKNQYQGRPGRDDPYVEELLKKYHREGITDRRELSKRFSSDHGIIMSEQTVARRKRQLGLHSSRLTTLKLSEDEKRQLILDQMSKDPKGRIGARTVKKGIFEDTGVNLTRDYIIEAMRTLDPQAYDARSPHHAKEKRKRKLLKEARQGSLSNGQAGDDDSGVAAAYPPDDPGPSSNGQGYDGQTSAPLELELEPPDMGSPMSQGSEPSPSRELEFEHHDLSGISPDAGPSSSSRLEPPRTIHLTERPQPTQTAMQLPRIAQLQLSSSVAGSPARPRVSTNSHRGSSSTSTQPSTNTTSSLSQPSSFSAQSHPPSQPQPTSISSPSPTSILNSLRETTPLLASLTRFLQTQDPSSLSGDDAREVLGEAMKCMEAAALLERQIARFAGGVKGALGGS